MQPLALVLKRINANVLLLVILVAMFASPTGTFALHVVRTIVILIMAIRTMVDIGWVRFGSFVRSCVPTGVMAIPTGIIRGIAGKYLAVLEF